MPDSESATEVSPLLHQSPQPLVYVSSGDAALNDEAQELQRKKPEPLEQLGAWRGWALILSLGTLIFLQSECFTSLNTLSCTFVQR
jgi:hypothetical protein